MLNSIAVKILDDQKETFISEQQEQKLGQIFFMTK